LILILIFHTLVRFGGAHSWAGRQAGKGNAPFVADVSMDLLNLLATPNVVVLPFSQIWLQNLAANEDTLFYLLLLYLFIPYYFLVKRTPGQAGKVNSPIVVAVSMELLQLSSNPECKSPTVQPNRAASKWGLNV
jgi:hypothetical protein